MSLAILALDRLNRAARCCDLAVAPGLIYAFKDVAIRRLSDLALASHRRVSWQAPACSNCGGNGWHRSPREDREGDGCHRCGGYRRKPGNGAGVVLRFVETTIRVGEAVVVWHSPVQGGGVGVDLWNELWPSEVGGVGEWRPRLPGESMPAHELARDLLVVEDWLGPVDWPYGQHLRVPRDSMAAEHPDVVRWARRHPEPPTWISAMQTVTSGTAPEHPEEVDDVPF